MKNLAIVMGVLLIGLFLFNANSTGEENPVFHPEEEDYGDMIGQEALKNL